MRFLRSEAQDGTEDQRASIERTRTFCLVKPKARANRRVRTLNGCRSESYCWVRIRRSSRTWSSSDSTIQCGPGYVRLIYDGVNSPGAMCSGYMISGDGNCYFLLSPGLLAGGGLALSWRQMRPSATVVPACEASHYGGTQISHLWYPLRAGEVSNKSDLPHSTAADVASAL